MSKVQRKTWTNTSVLDFAGDRDPVDVIREHARRVVLDALDRGWAGPPFDPLALAERLRLDVVARQDVVDARTLASAGGRLRIEFNPNRSRGRVRYSLAHEIAHTFFADCAERVRHRGAHGEREDDGWQLEALCNIAAAELLMPLGSLRRREHFDLDALLEMRNEFEVSTEAMFIRAVELTQTPCAVICASPAGGGSYRLDYVIGSRSWQSRLFRGAPAPRESVLHRCEAIGSTAKAGESWAGIRYRAEFIGLPPYPGAKAPRVVGLLRPTARATKPPATITYLRGDATAPRAAGNKLVVHVVNDATPNWGGSGFAMSVRKKWPGAQEAFRKWVDSAPGHLRLGNVHAASVDDEIEVATLVAQRGYGPSANPRIRYAALEQGLAAAAQRAVKTHASVHMPRIGCGQAGGSWDVVEELTAGAFCSLGVSVYVYDRAGVSAPQQVQPSLPWIRD